MEMPEKTFTVAGEVLTVEELRVRLEDLLGEQLHRKEENKNAEREYYYDALDYVSAFSTLDEQWYCPPELMSNRVLAQTIELLKELIRG